MDNIAIAANGIILNEEKVITKSSVADFNTELKGSDSAGA